MNNNLHIYSFNADAHVYTYNVLTGEERKFNCKSLVDQKIFEPLALDAKKDMNRKVEHLISNTLYQSILYDKYRNCYYRFVSKALNLKNSDGTYNNGSERQTSLMMIDKDFNVVKEYDLENKYLWFYNVVTKDGILLLRNFETNNEAKISIRYFIA